MVKLNKRYKLIKFKVLIHFFLVKIHRIYGISNYNIATKF